MIDEETLAQINGKYVCPPDAGPEWRTSMKAGIDMSLIETELELTPEQRLKQHHGVLKFALEVMAAGAVKHAAG
jgi:hypothetical protein